MLGLNDINRQVFLGRLIQKHMEKHHPWQIHGAGISANIYWGYIEGIHVTIYIYIYIYIHIENRVLHWQPISKNLKCKLKALVFPQAQHNDLGTPHGSKTRMPNGWQLHLVWIAGHSNGKTVLGPMAPSYFPLPTLRKGCLSLKWLCRKTWSSPKWQVVITW